MLKSDLLFDQASNPVLLLQPDCPLCAHLLHGSPWIHSSTGLGGETHSRCSNKSSESNINPVAEVCNSAVQHVHTLSEMRRQYGLSWISSRMAT